jgi:hypothetical protein
MRFSDIQKLAAGMNIARIRFARFALSMSSSGLTDVAIWKELEPYRTADVDCFACLKNLSV